MISPNIGKSSAAGAADKASANYQMKTVQAFNNLGGKELLSSYFDDINADPDVGNPDMLKPMTENEKGEQLTEAELKDKEKEATRTKKENEQPL